jgi:hypothetical protein
MVVVVVVPPRRAALFFLHRVVVVVWGRRRRRSFTQAPFWRRLRPSFPSRGEGRRAYRARDVVPAKRRRRVEGADPGGQEGVLRRVVGDAVKIERDARIEKRRRLVRDARSSHIFCPAFYYEKKERKKERKKNFYVSIFLRIEFIEPSRIQQGA